MRHKNNGSVIIHSTVHVCNEASILAARNLCFHRNTQQFLTSAPINAQSFKTSKVCDWINIAETITISKHACLWFQQLTIQGIILIRTWAQRSKIKEVLLVRIFLRKIHRLLYPCFFIYNSQIWFFEISKDRSNNSCFEVGHTFHTQCCFSHKLHPEIWA